MRVLRPWTPFPILLALALALLAAGIAQAQTAPRLDRIVQQGTLRVGTTGDFKPFSFLNPATNDYVRRS